MNSDRYRYKEYQKILVDLDEVAAIIDESTEENK